MWRDYLMAEGRIVGQRVCTGAPPCDASGGTWTWFLADHLGSTAVVTDASGNVAVGVQALAMIEGFKANAVLADTAYDSRAFREAVEAVGAEPVIPSNPTRNTLRARPAQVQA